MTYEERAKEMCTQDMEVALHKLMQLDYTRASGAVIEDGYLAFYHESGLYSVEHLKTGIKSLVYARNPRAAITLVSQLYRTDENEETASHSEKHILKGCIALMQQLVDEFEEWYRWQEGEDAIEKLPEDERFRINLTNTEIVRKLFLEATTHAGGTSTAAKCKELGMDPSEHTTFEWEVHE